MPAVKPAKLTRHARMAHNYAFDVVEGRIIACKWVTLACQRQLDDLARTGWDYTFDNNAANRVCDFIEKLPHVKGEWARRKERIKLEPWQIFSLTTRYGWKSKQTKRRRFVASYEEVARKNAKTTVKAGECLYSLAADGEQGGETYSAATTRDQAKIIFNIAKEMVKRSPGLRNELNVKLMAHSILHEPSGSYFHALSAEADTLDGLNPHKSVCDELHAHPTRKVYDVLETAQGSRSQPMLDAITTAGTDRTGICYEQRSYVTKILQGVIEDDSYFGIIYTLDDEDDWKDEVNWIKANPNLGISVGWDDMRRLARKAAETASAVANFLTKRMNIWVNADMAWMRMDRWYACGDPSINPEDFREQDCYLGIDLASRVDIAALVMLFVGEDQYTIFGKYWLPEETVQNSRNSQYTGWVGEGRITETDGDTIDFDYIEDEVRAIVRDYNVREVAFDPFQATQFSQHMLKERIPMVEIGATVRNFSEPMKQLQASVLDRKLKHNGCPVMTWMISNVVAHLDKKDNIFPNKELPDNKIDGVVATIMALGRAMFNEQGPSVYNKRGIITI